MNGLCLLKTLTSPRWMSVSICNRCANFSSVEYLSTFTRNEYLWRHSLHWIPRSCNLFCFLVRNDPFILGFLCRKVICTCKPSTSVTWLCEQNGQVYTSMLVFLCTRTNFSTVDVWWPQAWPPRARAIRAKIDDYDVCTKQHVQTSFSQENLFLASKHTVLPLRSLQPQCNQACSFSTYPEQEDIYSKISTVPTEFHLCCMYLHQPWGRLHFRRLTTTTTKVEDSEVLVHQYRVIMFSEIGCSTPALSAALQDLDVYRVRSPIGGAASTAGFKCRVFNHSSIACLAGGVWVWDEECSMHLCVVWVWQERLVVAEDGTKFGPKPTNHMCRVWPESLITNSVQKIQHPGVFRRIFIVSNLKKEKTKKVHRFKFYDRKTGADSGRFQGTIFVACVNSYFPRSPHVNARVRVCAFPFLSTSLPFLIFALFSRTQQSKRSYNPRTDQSFPSFEVKTVLHSAKLFKFVFRCCIVSVLFPTT